MQTPSIADLVADRTRTVNRLRAQLTGVFPGLERALDLTNIGPLVLLIGYQTPTVIRRIGAKRLETWLSNRHFLRADRLAETALQTAERQHTSLPGEKLTAQLVHTLAKEVMALNQLVAELDKAIEARFRDHHTFDILPPSTCPTPWSSGSRCSSSPVRVTGGANSRRTAAPPCAGRTRVPASP